jgi:hypothetical protein
VKLSPDLPMNFPQSSAVGSRFGGRREDRQANVADAAPDGQKGMR